MVWLGKTGVSGSTGFNLELQYGFYKSSSVSSHDVFDCKMVPRNAYSRKKYMSNKIMEQ